VARTGGLEHDDDDQRDQRHEAAQRDGAASPYLLTALDMVPGLSPVLDLRRGHDAAEYL
jgi:hypothetical protein